MTIIDCHVHLGRNNHISARVSELLKSMDAAKIDKALVFAGQLNALTTDDMLKEIAPHTDRLYGVAAVHPLDPQFKSMSQIQDDAKKVADLYGEDKIVAAKFYLGYDHYYPSDRIMEDYLMDMEDVGCPAIFHCGDCLNSVKSAKLKYAHPLNVDEVAVDYPHMNFIIAHVGYPWVRDTAEVCYKNKNVFTDISGFVYGDFTDPDKLKFNKMLNEFLDIAGNDKLLFGTDWPISNQASYLDALTGSPFGTDVKTLTDNVKKAFKLWK